MFGHIAATHGYTSREPNERCGIATQDEYKEPVERKKQQNEDEECINERASLKYQVQENNGRHSYLCEFRGTKRNAEGGIATHTSGKYTKKHERKDSDAHTAHPHSAIEETRMSTSTKKDVQTNPTDVKTKDGQI